MAKYFANDGWNDITIAIPFNLREFSDLENLLEVHKTSKLIINILIDNKETTNFLSENANKY